MSQTTDTGVSIEAMTAADWPQVREIYAAGIATGNATFEARPPDWADWDASHLPELRLVARLEGRIVAWAALSPVSDRCVYGGVAENSIYVLPAVSGRGVGRRLLTALCEQAEAAGIWTIEAGMFTENEASIALHRRCGFRVVGRRERLGCHHGVWRDVMLMERRSTAAGV
jgi:L-amino acid N-acyltransferase YncA